MHLGIRRHRRADADADPVTGVRQSRTRDGGRRVSAMDAHPRPAAIRSRCPRLPQRVRATQTLSSAASSRSLMRSGYDRPEAIQHVGNIEIGVNPGMVFTSFT